MLKAMSLLVAIVLAGCALLCVLLASLLLLALSRERDVRRRLAAADQRIRRLAGELENSNATLQNFAHITSHDLGAPVRHVNGFLTLLERRHLDELSPAARKLLGEAQAGGRRIIAMLADVLALAKVEGGSSTGETPVDLHHVVDGLLRDLAGRLEDSGAVVRVAELPTLDGDEAQMRLLFENLVGNSLKYAGPEQPRIEISADREGERWEVQVADNGIGVDPAHAERAFEMFRRLQTGGDQEGTGMGLALCKRIVERHGGRIWMEPSGLGGTSVRFTLDA
jgi:signal transduction histidine kinase